MSLLGLGHSVILWLTTVGVNQYVNLPYVPIYVQIKVGN